VIEVANGGTEEWFATPDDLGIARAKLEDVAGASPEENAAVVRGVLGGDPGPARDVACMNAAAAILVAGSADDLGAALDRARDAVDSGAALGVLERLVSRSHELAA